MKKLVFYVLLFVAFVASIAIGTSVALWRNAVHASTETEYKIWLDMLSLLGSWTSGIGAVVAAWVALHIANQQRRDSILLDRVRALHHTMAIVNDLRLRVHYLGKSLKEGSKPLAAITGNSLALMRRYEALYDRDLYSGIDGTIIERITKLSGSFFGIETAVAVISSHLDHKAHVNIPPLGANGAPPTDKLYNELDDLYTALEESRKNLEQL
ncbi:hypothetical protein [Massilia sp. TN1-12]|uniref:hypothetical protein n=1 Tax=Massilia paldalensis TaxID=3377675 RepID=UPI00384DD4F7